MSRRNTPAKPGELKAYYGRENRHSPYEVRYAWGGQGSSSPDGRILSNALEGNAVFGDKNLIEELEARGYDLSTLKFSIQMKKKPDA